MTFTQKNNSNNFRYLAILVSLLCLPLSAVFGIQAASIPFVNGASPVVPFIFTSDQTGDLATIEVTGFTGNLSWAFFLPPADPSPLSGLNIALPPGGTNNPARLSASGGGLSAIAATEVQLLVQDDGDPGSAMIVIIQFTIRDPFDVVLVLDQSGSMSGDVDPNETGVQPKIEELKDVAELFIQTARGEASLGLGDPGDPIISDADQISAVYFSSASDNKDVDLIPFREDGDDLLDMGSIDGMSPGGLTAMGQGIRDALNELDGSPDHNQSVIVITDGMQNVNPRVESTGGTNPTVTLDRNNNGSIQANETLNDLEVRIFSVGLNTPTSHNELLDDMAQATQAQAYFNFTPPNAGDLAVSSTYSLQQSFIDGLIDLVDSGSPQPVFYEYYSGDQTRTFQVNKAGTNLRILLKPGREVNSLVRFRLIKDGIVLNELDDYVRVLAGDFYQMAFINLAKPYRLPNGTLFDPVGEWTLEVQARESISYEVSGIIDDALFDYDLSFGDADNLVNETLAIQAQLSYRGQSLTDSVTVRALLLKPEEDLQSLLATTNTDVIATEPEGGNTATDKYQTLLRDPAFVAQLGLEDRLITLTAGSDNIFRGTFSDTDVTGTYRCVFLIEGFSSALGPLERSLNRFAIVRLHGIDYDDSDKELVIDPKSGFIRGVRFTPQGANSLLLGPGYARDINARLVKGSGTIGTIRDNLDGSYTLPISGLGSNSDPEIDVRIKGESFYDGLVSGFASGGTNPWLLEILAGLGIYEDLNGIGLGLELSRRFSRRANGLDLLVGPYVNTIIGIEEPNYLALGAGALVGVEYRPPTDFRIRLFGKLGGINPNLSDEPGIITNEWGTSVGIGGTLSYTLKKVEIGLRGEWGSIRSGMNANTEYQFFGLTLGFGF
ncbi:MAG: vWA domain-containing protein [Bacteroidota bacterium]